MLFVYQKNQPYGPPRGRKTKCAAASPRSSPRHAVNDTPDNTTGSRMKPTNPNCRPMKSATVRSDNSWVAVARTNWNLNEAQSCWAFQIKTGRNRTNANTAASHG